jgi:branched-chain amino acid transport system substrate-binding protein
VGGQWGRGKDFRFDVSVVSNRAAPSIPASGKLRPIGPA